MHWLPFGVRCFESSYPRYGVDNQVSTPSQIQDKRIRSGGVGPFGDRIRA